LAAATLQSFIIKTIHSVEFAQTVSQE
jgi:hypothetical protein